MNIKGLVLVIALISLSTTAFAGNKSLIWVAITDNYSEYQVPIQKDLFERLVSGNYTEEYLHLTNIYWFNEVSSKVESQITAGKTFGYSNEAYIRTKYILRILPLTEEHIAINGLTVK